MSGRCEYCDRPHSEEKKVLIEKSAFGRLEEYQPHGIESCTLCSKLPHNNKSLSFFIAACCGEVLHVKCYVRRLNKQEPCYCRRDIDLRHIRLVSNGMELCYICFKELNTKDLKLVQLNCCGKHVCIACVENLQKYEKGHNHYVDAIVKFKCMCGKYIIPNGLK